MKKIFITISIILLMVLSGWLVYQFTVNSAVDPIGDTGTFPDTGSGIDDVDRGQEPVFMELDTPVYEKDYMTTLLTNGNTISVKNIKSKKTVDIENREIFHFAENREDPDRLYDLTYYDRYDAFQVTILRQPVVQARSQAEVELYDALGVKPATLCDMRVFVRSNLESYKGKELGISFCPGAMKLQ